MAGAGLLGWHYWSNATCLMRPHLFSRAFLSLIRIIELAAVFATFEENLRYTSSVEQVVPPELQEGIERASGEP